MKITLGICLLSIFSLALQAQKNKVANGTGSLAAPKEMRIDGKDKEWAEAFAVQNKSTGTAHILSNDAKNLFLVIRSLNHQSVTKILSGGITFSVDPTGKRRNKGSRSLTYPFMGVRKGNKEVDVAGVSARKSEGANVSNMPSAKEMDAIMVSLNRKRLTAAKEVEVNGLANVRDTVVGIYNDLGIRIFAEIKDDNSFFCEIAIPLKSLGLDAGSPEFAYNIRLNGLPESGSPAAGASATVAVSPGGNGAAMDFQDLMSPTDFWRKYKLHK